MSANRGDSFCSASFPAEPAVQPGVLIAESFRRIWRAAHTVEYHCLRAWVIAQPQLPGLRLRAPRADGPWIDCPVGMTYVYAPGTRFWEDHVALAGRPFASIYLVFSDRGRQLAGLTDPGGGFAQIADGAGRLRAAIQEPYTDGSTSTPERWRCQASLVRIIGLLRGARPGSDGIWRVDGIARSPDLSTQVEAWLEAHLADRVSIAGLARHFGMPPSTLAHRYRAATRSSPMHRLGELRVQRLQVLLAKGVRLGEAAVSCGFCDAFHASRRFRSITGLTPTAWLATICNHSEGRGRP